jgi:SAM-dependent methyltransferase
MATREDTTAQPELDEAKVEEFLGKAIGDFSATMTVTLATIGDRLGLFEDLAKNGPATSKELAARCEIDERYALEWFRGMATAGYLEHDRASDRYTLPPEHAPVLAQEGGPMFMMGGFQMVPGAVGILDQLTEKFRNGGGVKQDAYTDDWWHGMQRFSDGFFENMLVPVWIEAMPDVKRKLEEGGLCADVGTGGGRAPIKLAQAFPKSRHVGFDIAEAQLKRARANAEQAGLGDRVKFERRDVTKDGWPEPCDVITTFDVIHDAIDPAGLLKAIREGLKDDGIYVCLDINCADDPNDNEGPVAAMMYGFSVLYCMTTSLAHGGEGLGTCGLPPAKLRELASEAGFSGVKLVPLENPFNNLYEVRP